MLSYSLTTIRHIFFAHSVLQIKFEHFKFQMCNYFSFISATPVREIIEENLKTISYNVFTSKYMYSYKYRLGILLD